MDNRIIDLLKERFVSRAELMHLTNKSDRAVRAMVQELKKEYPVISSSNFRGYKIATDADDLSLVDNAIRDNRSKAISIFEGQKKLKEFYSAFTEDADRHTQLKLDF